MIIYIQFIASHSVCTINLPPAELISRLHLETAVLIVALPIYVPDSIPPLTSEVEAVNKMVD